MKAKIYISYKEGILDPEGNISRKALNNIGLPEVKDVRFGKYIEMTFNGITKQKAEELTKTACEKLLANHNTETFKYEIVES